MNKLIREKAIIIGAGISGLLSARVLSDYFNTCILIESDYITTNKPNRVGVPQSAQPHILFASGWDILIELLPHLKDRLPIIGAIEVDWASDFHRYEPELGWNAASEEESSNVKSYSCSRPLLESAIREEVKKIKNITFLEGYKAIGFIGDKKENVISGVKIKNIKGCKNIELIEGNLIVDTAGRKSDSPIWLKSLGFESPHEEVVNANLGYATAKYRRPDSLKNNERVIQIPHHPPHQKHLGYLAQIENDEIIVTLGGYCGEFPNVDEDGFKDFAKSLPSQRIFRIIKDASLVSQIISYKATKNVKRFYEDISVPNGFLSLGDSVCATDPAYGQGITMSAVSARILMNWLKKSSKTKNEILDSGKFQKELAKTINSSWNFSTSIDKVFFENQNKNDLEIAKQRSSNIISKTLEAYMKKLQKSISYDPKINTLCMQVFHRKKSPIAFFDPRIIIRVLRYEPAHQNKSEL